MDAASGSKETVLSDSTPILRLMGTEKSRREDKLGKAYEGLSGDAVLARLADDGWLAALEAFWRLGDPAVAARVVGPVLRTGAKHLVALVVDEILVPSLGDPLPTQLLGALRDQRPTLDRDSAKKLTGRLLAPDPLSPPQYEAGRQFLEMWVLEEPGRIGEDFAVSVVAGNTPRSEDPLVRESAYQRCRASSSVLARAAKEVERVIEESPTSASWQMAAAFIESSCRSASSPPPPVVPIIESLVGTAPQLAQVPQFGSVLALMAGKVAVPQLREVLERQLPDAPGSGTLLRLIPDLPKSGDRAALFAVAVRTQSHLWSVLQPFVDQWGADEWKRGLRALTGEEQVARPIVSTLLARAPAELSAVLIEFASSQATGPEDQVVAEVAERLRERLAEIGVEDDTRQERVTAIRWPPSGKDEEIEMLAAILNRLDVSLHAQLVVEATEAGRISPSIISRLLPEGGSYEALRKLGAGPLRGKIARALQETRRDELVEAVAKLQGETSSLDLAEALAPVEPAAAFAGAEAAFYQMKEEEKEGILGLLEEHATKEQLLVLDAIVADTRRSNAGRRLRAAEAIAALLSEGDPVPESVIALLESGRGELQAAGVRVIGAVKPRDPELIRRLHELLRGGGVPGANARDVLDALANELLEELEVTGSKDEILELVPLLGAIGRPQVVAPLLAYIGPDAVYDDRDIRRAAARALVQACEVGVEVEPEEQAAMTGLLDGDQQEPDPEAREALSAALSRVTLGEDDALSILYSFLPYKVKVEPDRLFGVEKQRIVRHLTLYQRAKEQGERGWGLAITQLDIVAEGLVRAAYLESGNSEAIKEEIQSNPKRPDYGSLIGALSNVRELQAIRGEADVLHKLRSEKTEVPHAGETPESEDVIAAERGFKQVAKTTVGILQSAATGKAD